MVYANGDQFTGNYLNSKKNGRGTYLFKSGTVYEGEFKDDKF